jgi:hypothetical protein
VAEQHLSTPNAAAMSMISPSVAVTERGVLVTCEYYSLRHWCEADTVLVRTAAVCHKCIAVPLPIQAARKTAVDKVRELTEQLQQSDNHRQQLQRDLESTKVSAKVLFTECPRLAVC